MKHYVKSLPFYIAEKLMEKGMPVLPKTYGQVIHWIKGKGHKITIRPVYSFLGEIDGYIAYLNRQRLIDCGTWNEAANLAIEKALELMN